MLDIKIKGEIPQNETIFAACDSLYFLKFSPGLVKSIQKNTSKYIHIHIINPNQEILKLSEALKKEVNFFNKILSVSYEETKLDDPLFNHSKEFKKVYYACARFFVQEFFKIDKCLIVDTDSIFLTDFDYPDEDIGFSYKGTKPIAKKIMAGAFYYRKNSIDFIRTPMSRLGKKSRKRA